MCRPHLKRNVVVYSCKWGAKLVKELVTGSNKNLEWKGVSWGVKKNFPMRCSKFLKLCDAVWFFAHHQHLWWREERKKIVGYCQLWICYKEIKLPFPDDILSFCIPHFWNLTKLIFPKIIACPYFLRWVMDSRLSIFQDGYFCLLLSFFFSFLCPLLFLPSLISSFSILSSFLVVYNSCTLYLLLILLVIFVFWDWGVFIFHSQSMPVRHSRSNIT